MTTKKEIQKAVSLALKNLNKTTKAKKQNIRAVCKTWVASKVKAKFVSEKPMKYKLADGTIKQGFIQKFDNGLEMAVGQGRFSKASKWNIVQ